MKRFQHEIELEESAIKKPVLVESEHPFHRCRRIWYPYCQKWSRMVAKVKLKNSGTKPTQPPEKSLQLLKTVFLPTSLWFLTTALDLCYALTVPAYSHKLRVVILCLLWLPFSTFFFHAYQHASKCENIKDFIVHFSKRLLAYSTGNIDLFLQHEIRAGRAEDRVIPEVAAYRNGLALALL